MKLPVSDQLRRLFCGLGLALALATGAQGQSLSYTHNGSGMMVEQQGAEVTIRYEAPRAGLRGQGVAPGTRLFRGTLENNYLSGMAGIFRAGCGRLDYYVYGDFRLGRDFILTGAAPVLAPQGCAVVNNTHDGPNSRLVFVAAPGSPPAPALPALAGQRLCVTGIGAGSALNLRVGPGLNHGTIGQIAATACDVVAAPARADGWQAVHWQGRAGWASQRYLRVAP